MMQYPLIVLRHALINLGHLLPLLLISFAQQVYGRLFFLKVI